MTVLPVAVVVAPTPVLNPDIFVPKNKPYQNYIQYSAAFFFLNQLHITLLIKSYSLRYLLCYVGIAITFNTGTSSALRLVV